jgi:hypothetical protein
VQGCERGGYGIEIVSPQFGLYIGLRRPLYHDKLPNGAKKLTRVVLMQDIRPDVSWYLGLLHEGNFMRTERPSEGCGRCMELDEGGYLMVYDMF